MYTYIYPIAYSVLAIPCWVGWSQHKDVDQTPTMLATDPSCNLNIPESLLRTVTKPGLCMKPFEIAIHPKKAK